MNEHKLGFSIASQFELQHLLNKDVNPKRIIYNNPVKDEDDLEFAYENGIQTTTADSIEELEKIKYFAPNMDVLWRISTGS